MFIVLLLALAAPAPAGVTGAVSISVLDKSGAMVTDLRAEDVSLKEEGQPRVIKRLERDTRPLAVAVLVDSSEALGQGFLKDLADPVLDFVERLPPDVDRTVMLIGTPPEVFAYEDPAEARVRLRSRPPFGKLSLYDGIAEAATRLGRKSGTRRALVVVITDRYSDREEDCPKALQATARATPIVLALQFHGAGTYAPALDSIVKWSGGRYDQIGAVTGVGKSLLKLLPELEAPWLVVYETPSAVEARKVDVKVARKGTKVRVRPAGLAQLGRASGVAKKTIIPARSQTGDGP
jgi:hypothetical protein